MLPTQRLRLIASLSALSSAILLSACGHSSQGPVTEVVTVVRENYIAATPDEGLRHCQSRPGRPTLEDDVDTANLIARLDERGEDCASKLGATWQAIDETKANAERLNQHPQP